MWVGGQQGRQCGKLKKVSDRGYCWVGVLEKINDAYKKCVEIEDRSK